MDSRCKNAYNHRLKRTFNVFLTENLLKKIKREREKIEKRETSFTLANESEMRYDVNIAFSECVPRSQKKENESTE